MQFSISTWWSVLSDHACDSALYCMLRPRVPMSVNHRCPSTLPHNVYVSPVHDRLELRHSMICWACHVIEQSYQCSELASDTAGASENSSAHEPKTYVFGYCW